LKSVIHRCAPPDFILQTGPQRFVTVYNYNGLGSSNPLACGRLEPLVITNSGRSHADTSSADLERYDKAGKLSKDEARQVTSDDLDPTTDIEEAGKLTKPISANKRFQASLLPHGCALGRGRVNSPPPPSEILNIARSPHRTPARTLRTLVQDHGCPSKLADGLVE
jgi:hypothetical protein